MKEQIFRWDYKNNCFVPEGISLIRCKECIWLDTEESYDEVYHCELHDTDTIESNYCSWAERYK